MERLYVTINDVSELLGITVRGVHFKIEQNEFDVMLIPGKGRGGKQLLIALDSLPEEAQERYLNSYFVDPLQLFTEEMMQKYTIEQRNLALFRYTVVRAYCSSGMSLKAFVREKADVFEKPFSYKQLRDWRIKFFNQGIEGLMERRGRVNAGKNCIPTEAWDLFYSLYMTPQKRSVQLCYDRTKKRFPEMKTSYQTFTRRVREIPEYAKLRYREGMKAFNDKLPYMDRDKTGLHTNQLWISDHHRADVFVRGKDGHVFRPWITAITDAKSTKILACVIRQSDPNTTVIKQALRNAIAQYGVPEEFYTDNGKDYISNELNPDNSESVLSVLGIKAVHALPYHGQAKPIERFFRTLEDRFGKLFYSYAGHDAKNRPEHMRKTTKQLEEDSNIPTLDFYIKQFQGYVVEYNASPHSGKDMNGMSPDQVYENNITIPVRVVNSEILRLLCGKHEKRKVNNSGITLFCNTFVNYDGDLLRYLGKEVTVIYDPDDMETVFIYTLDGKFICQAVPKLRSPFRGANEEDYLRAGKQVKKARKLVRDYKPKRIQNEADVLFSNIAEEHRYQITHAEEVITEEIVEAKKAVSGKTEKRFNPFADMYDAEHKKGVI